MKTTILLTSICLTCAALLAAEPAPRPLYARPCEPQVVPAFLPLPIGAVEPQGWLRDGAVSARNGITGHLDEWNPAYAGDMTRTGGIEVSGLCNLDAMMETYSYSGDKRILDRVLAAVAKMAARCKEWEAGRLQPGHMVILYENVRLPAIMYPWSGDEHLLAPR